MRRIYLFIFTCIFASLVNAQRYDSLKVVQGSMKECFLLSDIDSITHSEDQDVNIYHNNIKSSYSITSIDSIALQHAKGDAFRIPTDKLNGWDEGVYYTEKTNFNNAFYIVSKTNPIESTKTVYIRDFTNDSIGQSVDSISQSITIVFSPNEEIQDMFILGYQFEAHPNENDVMFIVYDKEGRTIDCFNIPYEDSEKSYAGKNMRHRAIEHYRIVWLRKLLARAGKTLWNVGDIGMKLENGNYADILKDFLIGNLAGLYSKTFLGTLTTAELIDLYLKQLYENNKNNFLGSAEIEIKSIKRSSKSTISVKGEILNVSSIPSTRIVAYSLPPYIQEIPNYALYGVAEGKSGQPGLYLHDKCTTPVVVSGNSFTCSLPVEYKPGQTYYFRPFLVPGAHYEESADFGQAIGKIIATNVRYGYRKEYTDEAPSCSTISLVSTTDKSAVVKCSYNNIYNGIQCGVMVSSDNATMRVSTSSNDGEREISISGLEPATTYNYWAYIEVDGIPENGEVKSFTTNPPDISGTWTCTEEYYFNWDKNYDNPQYKSYPIVLKEDGTVSIDGKSDYVRSSWGYGSNGKLTIQIMDMATSDFNSGFDINLTADEAKAPKKFTGAINNWSFNSTVGYVSRGGHSVVLTR